LEAELFHADGQTGERTDMTKLTVAFCNFANEPDKGTAFSDNLHANPRNVTCAFDAMWNFKYLSANTNLFPGKLG
jgi:hypothetical protein